MDALKKCIKCGIVKTVTDNFYITKDDQILPYCRPCNRQYQREYLAKRTAVTKEFPPFKQCTACRKEKPRNSDHYHRNKNADDGYQIYCKDCVKEKKRSPRKRRKVHPEIAEVRRQVEAEVVRERVAYAQAMQARALRRTERENKRKEELAKRKE